MCIIEKAKRIIGNNLEFRDACADDAEFILKLRTDPLKNRYISPTSDDVEKQHDWLTSYEQTSGQAYFIATANGIPCGTVRMYDSRGDSFCWGSWLFLPNAPSNLAIESALIVYSYALKLGFRRAHFDVRKQNESVWKFHERFGAIRVEGNDDNDYFYSIDLAAILASLERYKRFLPNGIRVTR